MQDTYQHPTLGELYAEDVDWQIDEAVVSFSPVPIAVCLADGNEAGPSEAALAGYLWIEANWQAVRRLIQAQAFDFYRPYAAAVSTVPAFADPAQLWGTEEVLGLRVFAKDDFSLTMRFAWQEEQDPHEITFYVDQGRCDTHSVDG